MEKVSAPYWTNDFCPQSLFLYGTYKEDGTPNYGLFCWFSYCWDKELHIMACIGGEKLTKDLIHKNKVFSANLVNEQLLPLADYFGNTNGYENDKMKVPVETIPGSVLNVPILAESPWSFELEAEKFIPLDNGELLICKIRNILADKRLLNDASSLEERMRLVSPVVTTKKSYFSVNPTVIGPWGGLKEQYLKSI